MPAKTVTLLSNNVPQFKIRTFENCAVIHDLANNTTSFCEVWQARNFVVTFKENYQNSKIETNE